MSSLTTPSHNIELSQDAALVAALAGTAMSFSHSAEDQAERWLRALRLHGKVGSAMQGLGVGEAPLATTADDPPGDSPPLGEGAVDLVVKRAREHASERPDPLVGTPDLLFALLEVYGGLMDRALKARGASRDELVQRLAATGSPVEA
jgi:hypothetical protein